MFGQAAAAAWAARSSHTLRHSQLQAAFLNLQAFFAIQYGFDMAAPQGRKLDLPNKLVNTLTETAIVSLLDVKAIAQHPKPGGYSYEQWGKLMFHTIKFFATDDLLQSQRIDSEKAVFRELRNSSTFPKPSEQQHQLLLKMSEVGFPHQQQHAEWCKGLTPVLTRCHLAALHCH